MLVLLIVLGGAFWIGSPSFIIVACMGVFRRYVNRYFAYGALASLAFGLICYYLYSFFVDKAFYRFVDNIGCTPPQNEPDISLGIMHCYTHFNVFLNFFAFPLMIVLLVSSLMWLAMFIMLLRRYSGESTKAMPKDYKRKSFLCGIALSAAEFVLVATPFARAKLTEAGGNYLVVFAISISIALLIALYGRFKASKKHNAES